MMNDFIFLGQGFAGLLFLIGAAALENINWSFPRILTDEELENIRRKALNSGPKSKPLSSSWSHYQDALLLIDEESDPERRAEMIEQYGTRRYWVDSGAVPIHDDEFGTVYRLKLGADYKYYVCVVNSSPEPDGSFKEYFIPVPPYMVSGRHAVAWTFGMEAEDYGPAAES